MTSVIKIRGDKELIAFLEQFPRKTLLQAVRAANHAGAKALAERVRQKAPRESGDLKKSIEASRRPPLPMSAISHVRTKLIYARLVEQGHNYVATRGRATFTGRVPAQPYARPAFDMSADTLVRFIGKEIAKQILAKTGVAK